MIVTGERPSFVSDGRALAVRGLGDPRCGASAAAIQEHDVRAGRLTAEGQVRGCGSRGEEGSRETRGRRPDGGFGFGRSWKVGIDAMIL